MWCAFPELPQGQNYGLSKFLEASGQTRHWRNSPKLRGAGVSRTLILLASWRDSHGAQWHPDLHQLGSRVPPCRPPVLEGNSPFPRDPRNVVLTVSPYAVFFIRPPAGTLAAMACGVRKHNDSVSHPSRIHIRPLAQTWWIFYYNIKWNSMLAWPRGTRSYLCPGFWIMVPSGTKHVCDYSTKVSMLKREQHYTLNIITK